MTVLRPADRAVFFGMPDSEGNVVEMIRAALREKPWQLVWLTSSGQVEDVSWMLEGVDEEPRLRVVKKASLLALWHFLTAERVFYSHRLFCSPKPGKGRVFVNLWHGDGPKTPPGARGKRRSDSFVVAGTRAWGEIKARGLGVGVDELLVTGNPRIDQYLAPASDEALRRLGLNPDVPLVIWAPTFREASYGRRYWYDSDALSRTETGEALRAFATSPPGEISFNLPYVRIPSTAIVTPISACLCWMTKALPRRGSASTTSLRDRRRSSPTTPASGRTTSRSIVRSPSSARTCRPTWGHGIWPTPTSWATSPARCCVRCRN